MGDVHQNLLSHLKLNLAGLPDRRITEEMLAAVVQPFKQEVEEVHVTIVKKIWRDVIVPCRATLITLGLLLLLGWALKIGNYMQGGSMWNDLDATMKRLPLLRHWN